jgi:ppGpp synthetase/RelA/SpoT-type nucleotidyltranferase
MAVWAQPRYSVEQLNKAGRMLVRSEREDWQDWNGADWEEYENALVIVNNWRSSHGYPLNTFQVTLRGVGRRFEPDVLVAQRVKRLSSIRHKLDRMPKMKLSQMQDLGGCRAIFRDVDSVARVCDHYTQVSSVKHALVSLDDYVENPKASGYRGVHLVYRYFSDKGKTAYNGLKIEIQLRSQFQHAWATAVETVGMFSGQALKSSIGDEDWKRFFSLMGSAVAMRERCALVPGTPKVGRDLRDEIRDHALRLKVSERLDGYRNAMHNISTASQDAFYFLMQLDPKESQLSVRGFKKNETELAEAEYAKAESLTKSNKGTDAVLVSVESVNALSKAYPNYFADTGLFSSLMRQTIAGRRRPLELSGVKLQQGQLELN